MPLMESQRNGQPTMAAMTGRPLLMGGTERAAKRLSHCAKRCVDTARRWETPRSTRRLADDTTAAVIVRGGAAAVCGAGTEASALGVIVADGTAAVAHTGAEAVAAAVIVARLLRG